MSATAMTVWIEKLCKGVNRMACIAREGKHQCSWYVINKCVNPSVPMAIKDECHGKLPRFKAQGIKMEILSK